MAPPRRRHTAPRSCPAEPAGPVPGPGPGHAPPRCLVPVPAPPRRRVATPVRPRHVTAPGPLPLSPSPAPCPGRSEKRRKERKEEGRGGRRRRRRRRRGGGGGGGSTTNQPIPDAQPSSHVVDHTSLGGPPRMDNHEWMYTGYASDRIREEVVRPHLEEYDGDAGMADMMADFHDAWFIEGLEEEEDLEETAQRWKSQLSLSRDGFDAMLTVLGKLLLEGHILPKNTYESQRLLRALKMSYEPIHACLNGCVLFRGDHEKATHCPKCNASRFVEVDGSDGKKKQSKIPKKVLWYLPFLPRIQRLYMTEESAKQMTWHKNGKRYSPDKMIHPSDGDAWKHFDDMHPGKAMEARNVCVALATDGFNPFGMMAAPYTCNNMGVFMQPVLDELQDAWEKGAWCVHGKFPCPTCKAAVMFTWLNKGGKYSSFDKHRQFLPDNHEFRRDIKHFTKGVEVTDPIPQIMGGAKATLMDIKEKSKDNVKARLDVEKMCDRPKLVMKTPAPGKRWKRDSDDYILKRGNRKEVLQWIKTLMFPDGYAANLSRGVNFKAMKVNGMKSHDFHIWIQRLLPAMTQGYLPEPVWRILAELSYFFH
ncbi:uncharacterized protein [Miscanthus floridulus]|uniref:uncharacterized protein n=1 Tax=Miscanthus floridulus TaxID=154761 RepID=UPI0034596B23